MSILSPAQRGAAERLAADLVRVFGTRVRLVAAYEPADAPAVDAGVVHTLALVDAVALPDLSALLTVVSAWHKAKLATPLLLSREEFERSLDVFPIEYQSILARHEVLHGAWPEPPVTVGSADLRRACERQIKGHLIHLREGYLETHGRPSAVAGLIRASAPALRSSLQNVARLYGVTPAADDGLAAFAEGALGTEAGAVRDVLRFGREGQAADAAALLPRYLTCVEQLWRAVDRG